MRWLSDTLPEPACADEEVDDTASYDGDYDLDLTMPPTEDDVREQDRLSFDPPPRIVARFYRPSQARRKDSAASSRRNSISSAHSHSHSRCSSLQPSNPRSPEEESKYAAQQLRRTSFLEDRRARLADRAAHVEKVRLRAAMAKAAPRGQTSSEERLIAAQQARERNLAEIVNNCAEEVKKAKQIAEATKERREHDVAKMRAQMEERMAEAQKRREELRSKTGATRRRSRGQSLVIRRTVDTVAEADEAAEAVETRASEHAPRPPMTDDEAAARIQTWWRGCVRRKIMNEFLALGLHVDGIRDTSFDDVVQLLAQDKVLMVTSRLLRICGLREGKPGSVEAMAAVRTFLSAFLILGHPNQVLSNKDAADSLQHRLPMADLSNPQLQGLVGKAKDVLISFENCLASLTPENRYSLPSSMKKALPGTYAVFHNAFIAWKSRDSNALIEVMLLQFVELDAILETVSDTTDPAAAQLYRQSIQDSQLMLLVRIKRLAGPEQGKRMIAQAVREARRTRKSKKQTMGAGGDTKPRGVSDNAHTSSASGSTSASASASALASVSTSTSTSMAAHDQSDTLLTPPATPAGGKSHSGPAADHRGSRGLGLERSGLNGLLPDNRTVVHELAINHEYEIPSEDYVEQQAATTAALYVTMREALSLGDCDTVFSLFLLAAGFMKDKLQRLLNAGNSLHAMIGDSLDPELARRQFALGNFSYEKFFSFIAMLLPRLCAPFRDEEVQELVQHRLEAGNDLVDRLKAVQRFIDVMSCDYINYLLRMAAPHLIETSSQYEAKRFAEEMGIEGEEGEERYEAKLSAAVAAWRTARNKVLAEVQKRDAEGINHPKSRAAGSGARIYAQMLVDVFTQATPVDRGSIPEMLRLDERRITEVSTMIQRIVTAGAVLLQCKNLLKRDARSPWKAEAARIMAVLEASAAAAAEQQQQQQGQQQGQQQAAVPVPVAGVMAALEAGRSMPTATRAHLRALVTKVLQASQEMSINGREPREPVLRLLLARLRSNILSRLASGSSATEKIKAASTAGERLATLGLSEFVERVRHIADLLDRVGTVDRGAHSVWWDAVAERAREE